ncbi:MAG: hypothetical protein ACFFBI_14030 [Promethearchaeota archaeon]
MNKKRTIAIKDLRLRKIRNNLRSLLLTACRSIQYELIDEKREITKLIIEGRENPGNITNMNILREQRREIEKKVQVMDNWIDASIVFCSICGKSNKNMTYNPFREKWYCTECYDKLKKGYIEKGKTEEFP